MSFRPEMGQIVLLLGTYFQAIFLPSDLLFRMNVVERSAAARLGVFYTFCGAAAGIYLWGSGELASGLMRNHNGVVGQEHDILLHPLAPDHFVVIEVHPVLAAVLRP